jgi:hypothetical protein
MTATSTGRGPSAGARGIPGLAVLLLAACASAPRARPVELDPANPGAPESPSLAVAALRGEPAAHERLDDVPPAPVAPAAESTPVHQHDAAPAGHRAEPKKSKPAAVYTCPMHPEVRSDQPGTCPKCGMKLVVEKAAAPKGAKK